MEIILYCNLLLYTTVYYSNTIVYSSIYYKVQEYYGIYMDFTTVY